MKQRKLGGVQTMSTKDHEKSSGRPRRSGKPKQRRQKADQQQAPKPDQRDEDQIDAMVASAMVASTTDADTNDGAPPPEVPSIEPSTSMIGEVEPTDAPLVNEVAVPDAPAIGAIAPADTPAPADNRPVSIRTIARAYCSYTERSFQETSCFVEKLMGVRSPDKVIEVQTEFARQAYATFVAESQKICELYSELARESLRSWQGVAVRMTQAGR
jgi:Phasin protein